jgi:hypothetical protein
MNEDNLKKLHTEISKVYDIGNYDEFKSKMGTKELRKKFFDAMSAENFDLGDYTQYESRLSEVVTNNEVAQGWLKDPTGNKTWEYQSRECKWYARKIGTTTQYNISDNTKYSTSVQKLDAAYPNEIKGCKKTVKDNKDTNTDVKNKLKVDTNIEKAEPKVDTNIEKAEPEDPTTV